MITVCGHGTTASDLEKIKMVKPEWAGNVWKGIEHKNLVRTLQENFDKRGWKFEDPKLALDKTQAQLAGAFDLDIPELPEMKDQKFSLGFLTANDCTRSLRIVVGTTVFVCNNGMATGEIVMKKKHTTNFDLDFEIDAALNTYLERAREVPRFVESLQQCEISQQQADHVLMEAGRQRIMGWKKLGDVSQEFIKPTFADHDVPTSWGLYNAFTYVIKQMPARKQMDLMNWFRPLLPVYKTEETAA